MSYQVLARKWRPRNFASLVGQEHVVRALTHALEQKRLHHAWLFTGTRGVGKTTLSRILAKALNCIGPDGQGDITAEPCGVCQACAEIDAGRFVDYIEMDAASNRGVNEMISLLEQAIYAPSNARFKVYMIDEVHMLTPGAFNAMLKTLEEPPPHIKFILATTDPQKIPVTVLSRCLQFNLKQMPPAQIAGHLAHILQEEGVPFEPPALRLLSQAASGSMRDALSLTDQAIAYSAGQVGEETVRAMLGALDQTYLVRILDALAAGDGPALLGVADEIAARSLSYGTALQDLGVLLHHIALAQTVPEAIGADWPEAEHVRRLAGLFAPEDVQLHYQICIHGRNELALAPDEHAGFSMTLLRMLAFRPVEPGRGAGAGASASGAPARASLAGGPAAVARPALAAGPVPGAARTAPPSMPSATRPQPAAPAAPAAPAGRAAPSAPSAPIAPSASASPAASGAFATPAASAAAHPNPPTAVPAASSFAPSAAEAGTPTRAPTFRFDGDWLGLAAQLRVTGLTRQLVQQAELIGHDADGVRLRVPIKALLDGGTVERLRGALAAHFGRPVAVQVEVGAVQGHTAAAQDASERAARQAAAVSDIEADPFVQGLVKDFGASVVPGSVKPL